MSHNTIIFVGPSGAGKDTVADRIALLTGADVVSTSQDVRGAAADAGMVEPTRDQLQVFANGVREEHGADVFARMTAQRVATLGRGLLIVNGVRHPSEINVFDHPLVIGVDASRETRFERTLARGRASDPQTWEEFLVCDVRENGTATGTTGQQNYQCLARVDVLIQNEGDNLEGLEFAVDALVDRLIRTGQLPSELVIQPPVNEPRAKTLIVVNGMQGSGKTTIGRMLAEQLGVAYLPEIGGALRDEVTFNVLESGADFDREVMRRELLRDHFLRYDTTADTYVVETWHTGNIPYALQRSPQIAEAYARELQRQLARFNVIHILFTVDAPNFALRLKERIRPDQIGELHAFYMRIVAETRRIYDSLGLPFGEVDNSGDLSEAGSRAFSIASGLQARLNVSE